VLIIGWLLWLYDAVNNLSTLRLNTAIAHGRSILHVERVLHLAVESPLNHWLGAHHLIAMLLSNFYDDAHFVVTFALVGWLWWRHPNTYRPLRIMLLLTNVIGFVVFWLYPVAPPRMLQGAGFIDVVASTHAWGAWHSGALASQANELAAMPSLHMAWALWCGLALWLIARRWPLRALAVAYPTVVCIAVLGTANHYFLDVLAGAATAVLAAGLGFGLLRLINAHKGLRLVRGGVSDPGVQPLPGCSRGGDQRRRLRSARSGRPYPRATGDRSQLDRGTYERSPLWRGPAASDQIRGSRSGGT
jgi:membrane-associated phospholipid phosphatase